MKINYNIKNTVERIAKTALAISACLFFLSGYCSPVEKYLIFCQSPFGDDLCEYRKAMENSPARSSSTTSSVGKKTAAEEIPYSVFVGNCEYTQFNFVNSMPVDEQLFPLEAFTEKQQKTKWFKYHKAMLEKFTNAQAPIATNTPIGNETALLLPKQSDVKQQTKQSCPCIIQ